MLTGAAIEVPLIALAVWTLARLGVGDPDVPFMRIMRLTAVFAGVAALLTAGGIGRLAAYASLEGGRRRAMFVGARAHAVASAGLVLIAAIPHGHLPGARSELWLAYPGAGLVVGALCGVVLGVVCSGIAPVGLADVWSLARQPTRALRHLLSPEDLVKLGSALRSRTTQVFEGIFDPAPPPPQSPLGPPRGDDPEPAPRTPRGAGEPSPASADRKEP